MHYPLFLRETGKLEQQPLVAANGCPINPARLFVADKTTKYRFLIDTGSNVCVFSCKLIQNCKDRVNYDLYAANGSTIATYGWTPINVVFGLRRDFVWRFVVADVQLPIIGMDFLSFYNLLVDCRNNRLLDWTTLLSMPGFTVSDHVASVRTIYVYIPMDEVLQEFPDLTRPTGQPRDIRHSTVHYIRTTSSTPVSCRPHRLAPGRLKIAKSELRLHATIGYCTAFGMSLVFRSPSCPKEGRQLATMWGLQGLERSHHS